MTGISRIAPLVASILSSFESVIANSKTSSQPYASTISSHLVSHLARFKLWSASSGAHRPGGKRSLEYKLRDASSLHDHVVSLLKELRDILSEASGALSSKKHEQDLTNVDDELARYFSENDDSGGNTLDGHLEDIKHSVDRLLRLAVLIRNPNPHDHFSSRYGAAIMESSEPFDISHVREKFPGLGDELAGRLGRSLSIRRQYFLYREEHFNRLAERLTTGVEVENPNLAEQATTVASPVPRYLEDQNNSTPDPQVPHVACYDDIDSRSEISTTSYADSYANPDQLRVPSIPKEHANGPFKCPFCHSIVLAENRHAWKKHVFRDLQPYVCLLKNCSTPNRLYDRRVDWSQHMRFEHWRLWRCPFGCDEDLHSAENLEEHISVIHRDELSHQHTSELVHLCSVTDPTKARGDCVFCNQRLASDKLYISHVALHLEQLALFALPSVEYDQDDEEELTHVNDENGEGGDSDQSSAYSTEADNGHMRVEDIEGLIDGQVPPQSPSRSPFLYPESDHELYVPDVTSGETNINGTLLQGPAPWVTRSRRPTAERLPPVITSVEILDHKNQWHSMQVHLDTSLYIPNRHEAGRKEIHYYGIVSLRTLIDELGWPEETLLEDPRFVEIPNGERFSWDLARHEGVGRVMLTWRVDQSDDEWANAVVPKMTRECIVSREDPCEQGVVLKALPVPRPHFFGTRQTRTPFR